MAWALAIDIPSNANTRAATSAVRMQPTMVGSIFIRLRYLQLNAIVARFTRH